MSECGKCHNSRNSNRAREFRTVNDIARGITGHYDERLGQLETRVALIEAEQRKFQMDALAKLTSLESLAQLALLFQARVITAYKTAVAISMVLLGAATIVGGLIAWLIEHWNSIHVG